MESAVKQVTRNRFLIIAVVFLVIAGIGIASVFYVTATAPLMPGEQHSSNSPFSPLINENNKTPNADMVLNPNK
ncbi:MAG: hypothetical protein KC483_03110 [Nitrosarchaeum sp.]|nr:hypothetical protein [Nitrosarchaeum sp.]